MTFFAYIAAFEKSQEPDFFSNWGDGLFSFQDNSGKFTKKALVFLPLDFGLLRI
ncbi:hypothetical protein ACQCVP_04930 [Rossellomorea vietnamensis]